MVDFDGALKPTLKFEVGGKSDGGYTKDPADPGGETKWGIAKRYFPTLDIKNLTHEQARRVYYTEFWVKYKCDLVPEHLRITYFDMCIHPGPGRVVRLMQRAFNSLGGRQLTVDGILGLKTLTASLDLPVDRLRMYRLEYYAELVIRIPKKRKYWNGWKRRALTV